MKKPDYDNFIYNFSERFYQLRREPDQRKENGKKKSFQEISEDIKQRTDDKVKISHTQLSKYYKMSEDPEDDEIKTVIPNVASVIALADYYGVSLEYLLGLSDSKSSESKYQVGNEAFGLSDLSMEILEQFKNQQQIFNEPPGENNFLKFTGSDFINFVFDNLLIDFQYLCNKYLYEVQELEILKKANEGAKIDYLNIKRSLKNMNDIQKEVKRQEDIVKYRAFQISELIGDFLKSLSTEVMKKETKKAETD